eukprot:TRINITY_DN3983_c0_g1_i6.p1 TRINITY_DN3983_c0_g1~~TRINITY_DN3983_c0_g1_i6.p1  ORF type:complete len:248 (+),score=8.85 TRINITY_DN3983_c0_g1_i6:56-745(+)
MKSFLNVEKSSAPLRSSEEQRRRCLWEKRARQISYVSITITLVLGVIGLIIAYTDKSVALLGYALESFVDVWSSVLVLWRFWKVNDLEGETTKRREKQAQVGIAFTFVAIGIIVGVQAFHHLVNQEGPLQAMSLIVISLVSMILLSILFLIKMTIARQLQSLTMEKDATASGAVAVLSLGVLVSASIYNQHPTVWWVDSMVAITVTCTLLIAGIKTLTTNDWWNRSFWR